MSNKYSGNFWTKKSKIRYYTLGLKLGRSFFPPIYEFWPDPISTYIFTRTVLIFLYGTNFFVRNFHSNCKFSTNSKKSSIFGKLSNIEIQVTISVRKFHWNYDINYIHTKLIPIYSYIRRFSKFQWIWFQNLFEKIAPLTCVENIFSYSVEVCRGKCGFLVKVRYLGKNRNSSKIEIPVKNRNSNKIRNLW